MENVVIRKVLKEELRTLCAIGRKTFDLAFRDQNNREDHEAYLNESFSEKQIQNELDDPDSVFYFAVIEEEILGYLKLNREAAQTEQGLKNALEIQRIYLLPEAQGRGIGPHFVTKAKERAIELECNWVWLGVWEENPKAIQFYERHGFEAFGKHTFYLGSDPQRDLLMRLKLEK